MGMEIDPRLEDIALKVDKSDKGNKNNIVLDSDDEKEEFVKQAREAKIADEQIRAYFQAKEVPSDTIEGIFGLEKSASANEASQAAIERTRANKPNIRVLPDSVEGKAEMFVPVSVSDFKKNPSIKNVAKQMEANITSATTRPEDKKFYSAALSVANVLANKPLGTKEEIEKSFKEAKRQVEGTPGMKDMRQFKLAVLERLCAYAEDSVREKEFNEIESVYKEFKKSSDIDRSFKETKAAFKGKGSYYKDCLDKLQNTTLENDATKLRNEYRQNQKGTEEEFAKGKESKLYDQSSRDIKKNIKREMKQDQVYTKTVKKIDRRHGMSTSELLDPYEMSLEKGQDKKAASSNRVETRKRIAYTEEDIKDVLKNDDVFAGLVNGTNTVGRKPLVAQTEDANGNKTYNITELSDTIRGMISPGDYRGNVSDDKNYAEIENVVKTLSVRTGTKVTVADAKHLIDFCGFDRDHRNVFYDVASGVVNGLKNAVAPVTAGLLVDAVSTVDLTKKADFTGKMFKVNLNDYVKGDINVEIDVTSITKVNGETLDSKFKLARSSQTKLEMAVEKLTSKGYDAGYDIKDNGIFIWIKSNNRDMGNIDLDLQESLGDKYSFEDLGAKDSKPKVNRGKAIAIGAGISVAMGVISELMKPHKSEMSIINNYIQPDTTYNDFVYMLDSLEIPQAAKEAYKTLALQYVDKENDKIIFVDEQGNKVNCDEDGHILDKNGKPTEVVAIASWDRQGLVDRLHEIGGWQSKTNKHEGFGYAMEPLKFKAVPQKEKTTPKYNEKVDNEPNGIKFTKTDDDNKSDDNVSVINNAGRYGWKNLGRMYKSEDGKSCFDDSIAFRAMQVIQAIDPDAVKGKYDADVIREVVAKAFPRGNGKPDWNYINTKLQAEYPQIDAARLKSVLASPVSADNTKDRKVVAPLVLFDRNGEYNRGEPEREAPVAGAGKGNNRDRFNVVTKYTKVINGQTHYFLKPPGKSAYEVSRDTYNASKYDPK